MDLHIESLSTTPAPLQPIQAYHASLRDFAGANEQLIKCCSCLDMWGFPPRTCSLQARKQLCVCEVVHLRETAAALCCKHHLHGHHIVNSCTKQARAPAIAAACSRQHSHRKCGDDEPAGQGCETGAWELAAFSSCVFQHYNMLSAQPGASCGNIGMPSADGCDACWFCVNHFVAQKVQGSSFHGLRRSRE